MENKIILLFLIGLITSCSIPRTSFDRSDKKEIKDEGDDLSDLSIPFDSIFVFHCEKDTVSVRFGRINKAYFPHRIKKCLSKNGYQGQPESNKQIAQLIDILDKKIFTLFDELKFRGPEIFEALMKKSDNYELLKSTAPIGYKNIVKGRHWKSKMVQMIDHIKSLKNEKPSEWIQNQDEFTSITRRKTREEVNSDEYIIKKHKINMRVIQKAWKEGKIILKAYGEE